jgi:hypothetical protein
MNAARCKALSKRAWRPDVSRSFNELAAGLETRLQGRVNRDFRVVER